MSGIVMRTEKHPPGTAVQSADHSVRRRDRTKIPTQLRASMKQRTEPVFDAASAHYNLDMPSRFGALSYTQEKRVDVGRGHQANESSVVKKVAIIQRIRNNVVQRCGTGEGDTDARSSKLVFGSKTKSNQKLSKQMKSRGWTEELIRDTVDNPFTTRESINKATGNKATVFYTEQGSHVIVDNVTNAIVQISDNINPLDWMPDKSIKNPYKP